MLHWDAPREHGRIPGVMWINGVAYPCTGRFNRMGGGAHAGARYLAIEIEDKPT